MRPIKFRAWGGSGKKYFVYFQVPDDISDDFIADINLQDDGSRHILDKNEIDDIQQFTGLLDKNGKEIYEGDVVSGGAVDIGMIEVEVTRFIARRKGGTIYPLYADTKLEVLGNIYENPELIK